MFCRTNVLRRLWGSLLLFGAALACLCLACRRDDQVQQTKTNTFDSELLNTWAYQRIVLVRDAVRASDSNAVSFLRKVLLSDTYYPSFLSSETEHWQAESSFLGWQHSAAIEASSKPEIFGNVLVDYYYADVATNLTDLSSVEQLHITSMKLIQQGALYESRLNETSVVAGSTNSTYEIRQIQVKNDAATVDAVFLSRLASRGYRIQCKRVRINDADVWLPYEKRETWLN